jgi:MFS family permease
MASLGPLRERPFALLFAATGISAVGDWASAVALSFGVLAVGSATDLGLVFLAREIPIVVLVLAGGVYADRLPRRSVLVGADLARAGTQLGSGLVLLGGSHATLAIALLQAVNGGATAFARPASAGFVPEVTSPRHLQSANALMGLSRNTVAIVGASLGAALVAGIGAGWALVIDAGSFLVAAVLIAAIRGATRPASPTRSPLADLREGFADLRARTWAWVQILAFGIFQLAFFPAYLVLGPSVARDHLGGAATWAAVLTASAIGGLVGGAIALRVRPRRPLVFINLVFAGTVAELLLLAALAPVPAIVAASFCSGVGFGVGDPIWFTTLQRLVPEDRIRRISSFDWLGSLALNPIGYALVGPLAAAAGERSVLAGAGVLLAGASALPLCVPAVRAVRLD